MSNLNENEVVFPEVVDIQTNDSLNTSASNSSLSGIEESNIEVSTEGEDEVHN